LSGLKSVTTDNRGRGALTIRPVATGLPTTRQQSTPLLRTVNGER
jgi:hypothetical protein